MTALAPRLVRVRAPAFGSRAEQAVRALVAVLPLAMLLAAVSLAHLINMGNYPYYENDEGTYLAQAWAVVAEGRLAPYTYWYDHAPAGWLQIGLWSILTGGFFSFGASVESGRVLMLVYQGLSAYLVYRIARAISGSWAIAALAVAIFGFSALGIYLHRRVLLDNITTLWMLVGVALVVGPRPTLARVWASAAAIGIAILSKEVAVFVGAGHGLPDLGQGPRQPAMARDDRLACDRGLDGLALRTHGRAQGRAISNGNTAGRRASPREPARDAAVPGRARQRWGTAAGRQRLLDRGVGLGASRAAVDHRWDGGRGGIAGVDPLATEW